MITVHKEVDNMTDKHKEEGDVSQGITILLATNEDIPTILEIALSFWKESPTYSLRPINLDKVKRHLEFLIRDKTGIVLKAVNTEGKILGGFLGGIVEEWQADSLMAFDYGFFVSPNNRGSKCAPLLINAFLYWAKSSGATYVQCGTATQIHTERTIKFYEKMGFSLSGSFLEREL